MKKGSCSITNFYTVSLIGLLIFLFQIKAVTQPQAGDLLWYKHTGYQSGTMEWQGGFDFKVGSGWHQFSKLFATSNGVIYGLKPNGDLVWYKHSGYMTGAVQWSGGWEHKVGEGWGQITHLFATSNGVIYAVKSDGNLAWYKHTGYNDGSMRWEGGLEHIVGSGGWTQFSKVFAGPNGVIYGVRSNGDLVWYKHTGFNDGSVRWEGGGVVGNGWNQFTHLFATNNGIIYGVKPNGDLAWYKHVGYNDGSARWEGGGNVGSGWQIYKNLLSTDNGIIYGVAGSGTRVMTRFDPTVHGFKFVNNFTVQTQIAGFNGPTFSGLCGGMVYAALDYFHAGMTIPQQDYMPAEGMPLQSYLYNRQMNSVLPNADKWAEYGFNPGGARNREFFNWGLQLGGGRLGELRSKIDRGEPVPLGLQSCGNDCGCPGGCPGSHQVLAIGYDMGGYRGDLGENIETLSIFVYDPNEPGRIMTLKPHVAGAMYLYSEDNRCRWRAYFTDMKYSRANPPVIPNNPNELIVTFKTGSDDLRGGNDNVHLILLLRSGATMRFDNVNNLKRWVDWSVQNISRPLDANFRAEDVVGVRLETTFGGGMGGDNWNLDELTVKTRLNGVERTILTRAGAPLVRFTGDHRAQEFRR